MASVRTQRNTPGYDWRVANGLSSAFDAVSYVSFESRPHHLAALVTQ